ncbi:HupE/UreJ family protein [Bacillus sp. JJ1609]|uniref:HupE/UreJ family protein n=1 Tax=Bacillus sp. JJ1609 TaxID=3122977 RepID=UPI0030005A8C
MKFSLKKYVNLALLSLCIFVFPYSASAHTDNSEGYSKLSFDDKGLVYEIQIDYLELARVIDLGINSDDPASVLEAAFKKHQKVIEEYFLTKLSVFNQGAKVEGVLAGMDVKRKLNRDYAVFTFHFPIKEKESAALQISNNIFFDDNDPSHRNVTTYELGDKKGQFVFTANNRDFHLGKETMFGQSIPFIRLGFQHILIGLDHILFIIALVVTSRKKSDVFKIITLFTVAHSVTLGLAAMELISIPSQIVEPLIALSIAFVAIERVIGLSEKYRYGVVFVFGLIHGIGFAGALELPNPKDWAAIWPVLTFNVGVEFGQALIIALLFPMMIFIRRFKWSYPLQLALTSVIFFIGLTWYFQRFLT